MVRIFNSAREFVFFLALFIIAVVSTVLVYSLRLNGPPIRSDGLGYFSYLPASIVYRDLGLNSFIASYASYYHESIGDNWYGAYIYEPTGKYVNKYPIGVALLGLPLYLVAHLGVVVSSNLSGVPVDGFSHPLYHIANNLTAMLYAIAGLVILKRMLETYFSETAVYLTLIAITFGTNLFHYFTYDAAFSHAYSFFLISLFLYQTVAWYQRPTTSKTLLLGLVLGLITLVRQSNILVGSFFILYGLSSLTNLKELPKKLYFFLKNYDHVLLLLMTSLAVAAIQFWYWYSVTGKFFVYTYRGEGFNFLDPQLFNVLFSVRKGLFFWSPVLLLVVPGIALIRNKVKGFAVAAVLYFLINAYVVSCWWMWSYGGSFGMRALTETFPFLAFFIAATIDSVISAHRKSTLFWLVAIIIGLSAYSLFLMVQYWRGIIPFDETTFELFIRAFQIK